MIGAIGVVQDDPAIYGPQDAYPASFRFTVSAKGVGRGVIECEDADFEIPAEYKTEPALKGQTASGSFKPAMLSNGVRCMVPQHIEPGTRVVVSTADGSYVERAKD